MSRCPIRHLFGGLAVVLAPFLVVLPAHAADEFAVSPAQIQALGVQLHRLDKPAEITGPTFAARVSLPPQQDRVVSAPLAGVVEQLLVGDNDRVRAGQALLTLAGPEFGELQLKLLEAGSRARLSAKTLQRERQLLAEGIVPERRVLEAEAAQAEDQARRAQAEAALRLTGVDEATIRRVAEGGRVETALALRSPIAGQVSELKVRPGQRVQPADALLHVADVSRLWLDIPVPLARQAALSQAPGTPVTVVGREAQARITGTGLTASDSQTITLRAEVQRGGEGLRPGEFVQVRVPFSGTGAAAWAVPLPAVMRDGDKAYVFVRTAKGFVARPVTVIASAGQSVQVQGELKAGQEIAASAVIALKAAWQGKDGGN